MSELKIYFNDLSVEKQEEFLRLAKIKRSELDVRYLDNVLPISTVQIDPSSWITEDEFSQMLKDL